MGIINPRHSGNSNDAIAEDEDYYRWIKHVCKEISPNQITFSQGLTWCILCSRDMKLDDFKACKMKTLIVNGSPRVNGNTSIAINEMVKEFNKTGIEAEILNIGNQDIRGCIACNTCAKNGKCVFNDAEGLYNMRVLARNMSFLMKSIALGREKFGLPEREEHQWTHFVMNSQDSILAAVRRELGRKWAAGIVVWQCVLAWVFAYLVYLVGGLII